MSNFNLQCKNVEVGAELEIYRSKRVDGVLWADVHYSAPTVRLHKSLPVSTLEKELLQAKINEIGNRSLIEISNEEGQLKARFRVRVYRKNPEVSISAEDLECNYIK